jgi:predicted permease
MTLLRRLASIIRGLVRRRQTEADMDDELRAFVEMAAADARQDGATEADARRLAALQLGGVEQVKEQVRSGRHGAWLDEAGRDARYALRQIRRAPAFSAIAITTLALGIGVNTAMFSAVDAILIRPLPYTDADRLAMIWVDTKQTGESKFVGTPPEWREWRRGNTAFTDVAASQPGDASLSGDGEPEELRARKVTGNFWSVLGVRPIVGRVFTEAEDTAGARVVVLGYGLWERRFGGSPDIVGRTITLNDTAWEVVGVMPRGFYFLPERQTDVWMPTSFSPRMLRNFGWHDVHAVGRLRPGVSVPAANASMAALNLKVTAQLPIPRVAVVTPLRDEVAGKTYTALLVLLGAAASVLLIACLNLANLLMARGAARRREVAVRAALGAGRGRLVRQFLIESLVLAGLGAAAGLALALPIMRFLETLTPPTMAAVHLTLNGRVLAAATGFAIAAAVIFGLLPAVRSARFAIQDAMRDGGRGSAGARSHRLQHALIVAQTALAVALLTTGGLLVQTLQRLEQVDLGIRRDRVVTLVTPLFRYREFERRVTYVNEQLDRIRAIPGVVTAGAISRIPLTVTDQATYYRLPGQADIDTRAQVALSRVVTRGYFATVGATFRDGRDFGESDRRSDAPVAIVNESFAHLHFAGVSPVGSKIQFGNLSAKGYWYTIVGVVREIRERGVAEALRPAIYRLHDQGDQTGDQPSGIVVRTAGDPAAIVPAIRQAIWSVDKNQPIARIQTLDDIVDSQLSAPSQNTVLLGACALLALVLASIGLYGVLSYAVAQRTNEIGVRIALGAQPRDIVLAVSGRGMALAVAGATIGLALAVIAARAMQTLFYGFPPRYLVSAMMASAILLGVAALACFVPARRATRINPVLALQQQ